jgi:hypothetical protein
MLQGMLQRANETLYPGHPGHFGHSGRTAPSSKGHFDGQIEDPRDKTPALTRLVMGMWKRGATLAYLQQYIQQQVQHVLDQRRHPRPPNQPAASLYKRLEQLGWHPVRSATTGHVYYWNEHTNVSQYDMPSC